MVMEAKDVKVGVYFKCHSFQHPTIINFVGVITKIKDGIIFYKMICGIDTETKYFPINSHFARDSIILPSEIAENLWLLEV